MMLETLIVGCLLALLSVYCSFVLRSVTPCNCTLRIHVTPIHADWTRRNVMGRRKKNQSYLSIPLRNKASTPVTAVAECNNRRRLMRDTPTVLNAGIHVRDVTNGSLRQDPRLTRRGDGTLSPTRRVLKCYALTGVRISDVYCWSVSNLSCRFRTQSGHRGSAVRRTQT